MKDSQSLQVSFTQQMVRCSERNVTSSGNTEGLCPTIQLCALTIVPSLEGSNVTPEYYDNKNKISKDLYSEGGKKICSAKNGGGQLSQSQTSSNLRKLKNIQVLST